MYKQRDLVLNRIASSECILQKKEREKKQYINSQSVQRKKRVIQKTGVGEAYETMGSKAFWKDSPEDTNNYTFADFQMWSSNYKQELEREMNLELEKSVNARTIKRKLETAMNTVATVAHYTSPEKLLVIDNGGRNLRSYDYLKKHVPKFDPKTQKVDVEILGNTGFIFGYLEHLTKAKRPAGRYGSERLQINPHHEFYHTGDLMLNDYVDFELPDLVADTEGNLSTKKRPGDTLRKIIDESNMDSPEILDTLNEKYENTRIRYGGELGRELQIAKRKNHFIGTDIAPGFAAAVAVEALRMDTNDPEGKITKKLSEKSGTELIEDGTYKIFRPQAMIPTGSTGGVSLDDLINRTEVDSVIDEERRKQ